MSKTIRIECTGVGKIKLEDMEPIQGDLKSLSTTNFEKLKNQILTYGFSAPFFLWKNPKKTKWSITDGTQRFRVLTELKKQGYEVPALPYVEIHAKSELEAKKKLLSYVSTFGKVDKQGLYSYIIEAELGIEDMDDFEIPEVDMEMFKAEYFDGLATDTQGPSDDDKKEDEELKQCENCGHIIR